MFPVAKWKNVSECDILSPIDHFSDIENLVSFGRAMFKDFSLKKTE